MLSKACLTMQRQDRATWAIAKPANTSARMHQVTPLPFASQKQCLQALGGLNVVIGDDEAGRLRLTRPDDVVHSPDAEDFVTRSMHGGTYGGTPENIKNKLLKINKLSIRKSRPQAGFLIAQNNPVPSENPADSLAITGVSGASLSDGVQRHLISSDEVMGRQGNIKG